MNETEVKCMLSKVKLITEVIAPFRADVLLLLHRGTSALQLNTTTLGAIWCWNGDWQWDSACMTCVLTLQCLCQYGGKYYTVTPHFIADWRMFSYLGPVWLRKQQAHVMGPFGGTDFKINFRNFTRWFMICLGVMNKHWQLCVTTGRSRKQI